VTPESYLGFRRLARYAGSRIAPGRLGTYTFPDSLPQDALAYGGSWQVDGESILTLGQSGFIQFVPPSGFTLDPHFGDQLELYRGFHYKPMRLFHDTRRHD